MENSPGIEFALSEHVKNTEKFRAAERDVIGKRMKRKRQRLADWKKLPKVKIFGKTFVDKGADTSKSMSKSVLLGVSEHVGVVTECGRFLEIWIPAVPIVLGMCADEKKIGISVPETREAMALRVNHRASKQIRRLVNSNDLRGMLTLTFAPPGLKNNQRFQTVPIETQKDYAAVRDIFHKYRSRLRKRIKANTEEMENLRESIGGCNPKYVVVFELHDSPKTSDLKRGTWHVHLAVDCNHQLVELMRSTWTHGITDFQNYKYYKNGKLRDGEISNPGAYMAEYIGKDGAQFGTAGLCNKKRYTASRGVKRPKKVMISGGEIEGDIEAITYNGKKFINTYYRMQAIPGTSLFGVAAHYMEVSK